METMKPIDANQANLIIKSTRRIDKINLIFHQCFQTLNQVIGILWPSAEPILIFMKMLSKTPISKHKHRDHAAATKNNSVMVKISTN